MSETAAKTITGFDPANPPFADCLADGKPVILKGAVGDWPLVQAGLRSAQAAMSYLREFYNGAPVTCFTAEPHIGGKFGYTDALDGFNFKTGRQPLTEVLETIGGTLQTKDPPSYYIGSTDVDLFLPGLAAQNPLPDGGVFGAQTPIVSAWIGNRTTARAHYDFSNNIACCAVGQRQFTLFPPDCVQHLYPGPLSPTPGGQVISMVDVSTPDLSRHPEFEKAMDRAVIADLEPGDALIYPAMWWHQVEALAPFNVLINYWWNEVPAHIDSPQITLLHALLSLRGRPESEKAAWKALFDFYVFGDPGDASAHLPEHARGYLGDMDPMTARRLRAEILNRLNR